MRPNAAAGQTPPEPPSRIAGPFPWPPPSNGARVSDGGQGAAGGGLTQRPSYEVRGPSVRKHGHKHAAHDAQLAPHRVARAAHCAWTTAPQRLFGECASCHAHSGCALTPRPPSLPVLQELSQSTPGGRHQRASSWDHSREESAVLTDFARAAALVGPTEAASRALAERSAKQGAVAHLKQALIPRATAAKATSRVAVPPKAKHVHTLVLESWSRRSDQGWFVRTLWELSRRPVLGSPVVALKVLIVVHKLMQQGAPETLPAVAQHGARLLDGIRVAWPQRKAAADPEHADVAVLVEVRNTAQLLHPLVV